MAHARRSVREVVPVVAFPVEYHLWWTVAYIIDYAMIAVLALITALVYTLLPTVTRYIAPGDPEFSYPSVPESFPDWLLFVLVLAVPIVTVLVWLLVEMLARKGAARSSRRFAHELHCFVHGHVFTFCVTLIVVQILKSTIGYYRPNYYAHPAGGNAAWPSGHSALSTGLFLFLSLWMAGKTHLFFSSHALYLLVLCFCPLVLALVISASRIHDYFHSPADVISGMSFGAFVAILSYMTIYHSLFSPLSGLPVNRQNPHWHNKNEQEVVAEPLAEIQPDPPSPGDEMRFQVEPAVVRAAPSV